MHRHVLLVDDEPEVRENLRAFLECYGYDVEVAEHGSEALRILRAQNRPCCVVLDLFMPVMDGWRFLDELEAGGKPEGVRVVVSTSAPEAAPSNLPVISKPVNPQRLLEVVGEACRAVSRPTS